MTDVGDCYDRLEKLASVGSVSPREDAIAIVRDFRANAGEAEIAELRHRLEADLLVQRDAIRIGHLLEHLWRVAVLEGAIAATSATAGQEQLG